MTCPNLFLPPSLVVLHVVEAIFFGRIQKSKTDIFPKLNQLPRCGGCLPTRTYLLLSCLEEVTPYAISGLARSFFPPLSKMSGSLPIHPPPPDANTAECEEGNSGDAEHGDSERKPEIHQSQPGGDASEQAHQYDPFGQLDLF